MSIQQNKALVSHVINELNNGNLAVMAEVAAPDILFHFPGNPPLNLEGFGAVMTAFFSAFPDLKTEIEELVAEEDTVVRRGYWHGTHLGEFNGLTATGKQVTVPLIAIERIKNGKLVEHRAYPDLLSLMQQIGAIPAPA